MAAAGGCPGGVQRHPCSLSNRPGKGRVVGERARRMGQTSLKCGEEWVIAVPAGPIEPRAMDRAAKMPSLKVIVGTVRRLKRESGCGAGIASALKPELPPQR